MTPRTSSLALAALLAGCGQPAAHTPAQDGTFIALKREFADFTTWEPFPVQEQVDGGNVHLSGARTVYLKARPPAGSTTWPTGTVIVKKMDDMAVDPATGEPPPLFAMVKRGGSFNASGAVGWEWFGLVMGTDGQPLIEWRGLGPPSNETYGASQATCNACHAGAGDDAVMTLRLADVAR